jgi:nucleoside-diphosphate-sugar epimerase
LTLLVTGASGFLGANVVEAALAHGLSVLALSPDGLPESARRAFATLPGQLTECRVDLSHATDLGCLMRDHRVRLVANLAAITPPPNADPQLASSVIDVNVLAALALLEAAAQAGVQRFLQASSSSVYGPAVFGAMAPNEDTAATPITLYAISKLAAERLALSFGSRHGLDVICTRITALFGPWERYTGVRATLSVPFQLAGCAARGEEVVLALGGARDWTYAPEVGLAILMLLGSTRVDHRLFNLSCGRTWNVADLAAVLQARFPRFQWRFAGPGEQPSLNYFDELERVRSAIDNQRLASVFRFERTIRQSLEHYTGWVAEHADLL